MARLITVATWSSGMIPASGAGGPGFNSRSGPYFYIKFIYIIINTTHSITILLLATPFGMLTACVAPLLFIPPTVLLPTECACP